MSYLNINPKQAGDQLTAVEFNQVVTAIQNLQKAFGWGVYFDTQYGAATPQVITGDGVTWNTIRNNAGNKVENYLPYEIDSLYDPVTNKILASQVGTTGGGYINFIAKTSVQDGDFEIGLDIGGGVGVIFRNILPFPRGQNVYHPFTIPINAYTLDTFVNNNATPVIKVPSGDTVSIYGTTFFINTLNRPL